MKHFDWVEKLQEQHAELEVKLMMTERQVNPDANEIAKIKRKKLFIKDKIASIDSTL